MIAGDRARVQTYVAVSVADAFDVFTNEIDQWWRRGPQYRIGGKDPGTLHMEGKLGGRIFEQHGKALRSKAEPEAEKALRSKAEPEAETDGEALHVIGIITAWEPPHRLEFEWRAVNFVDGERTIVEILFEARGDGTRVTLEHRGWAAIRGDHPVRHGKAVGPFLADMGMWWAGLLRSLSDRAVETRPSSSQAPQG